MTDKKSGGKIIFRSMVSNCRGRWPHFFTKNIQTEKYFMIKMNLRLKKGFHFTFEGNVPFDAYIYYSVYKKIIFFRLNLHVPPKVWWSTNSMLEASSQAMYKVE